jgi:hypothetical protein
VLDTFNAGLQEAFTGNQTTQGLLENAQEVGQEVLGQ